MISEPDHSELKHPIPTEEAKSGRTVRTVENEPSAKGRPASGQAKSAAKRITGWTSNLLAMAIIIVIGMTFGLGTIKLWNGNAKQSLSDETSSTPSLAWNRQAWTPLEFSNIQFQRREFHGTNDEAIQLLVENCEQAGLAVTSAKPTTNSNRQREFLERLIASPPTRVHESGYYTYHLDGPIPMVVTIGIDSQFAPNEVIRRNDFDKRVAVLSWGLALPQRIQSPDTDEANDNSNSEEDTESTGLPESDVDSSREEGLGPTTELAWTLFTFEVSGSSESDSNSDSPIELPGQITLPVGSLATFSIGDSRTEQVASFSAPRSLAHCRQHFQTQFQQNGWAGDDWMRFGHGSGRIVHHPDYGTFQIQLDASTEGQTVGLISWVQNSDE